MKSSQPKKNYLKVCDMRTIKFRGFNKKNQKWIYGYYFVNRGKHFIVEDGIADPLNTWEDYVVDEETIGQFTGVKDRNSVEIYEGDIVRYQEYGGYQQHTVYAVKYLMNRCSYNVDVGGEKIYNDGNCEVRYNVDYTVLGNVHDNPELLKSL